MEKILRIWIVLLVIEMSIWPVISQAKDLGRAGNVFAVSEESFSQMMMKRLEKLDMKKHEKEFEDMARKRIEVPKPVENISRAEKSREWLFDPSYEVEEDIVLPCGKLLYAAGWKVNPLEHMDLERRLVFIDERDEEQKEWLRVLIEERDKITDKSQEDRIILVGGSVFKMKNEFEEEIYFDQFGELTSRFGIKAVPAIAVQEGVKIRINEISME